MDALKLINGNSMKENPPVFCIGDTVRVDVKIREGDRERIQAFEGTVIAKRGSGVAETFTVRRVSYGVGVERVFPLHSPNVADVKIIRVPCSCRVNPMFILRAFEKGADGVILCGCHPGDCHYSTGNYYARRRMALLFSMLDYIGVEHGRTRVEWVSAAEGVKFSQTMNEFVAKITSLGKNVRLEDLRCRK